MKTGTTFAGYRVESLVGRGGMGVVYRATDLSLERPVALKLIAPELAEDERFRARFLREPRLAASLDHPNVIPIYEAGEHDGQLYLAMRFVEGSDLKSVLEREGRLAPERALAVLAQVADALDAAHRRALVHRDVKPANVLLDEDGHAYLTDFGITKQLGGDSTDTGRVVGTLDYLAPEQIRGEPVDGRTDVYALGCVLYECLAGAPPFRRATEAETLWAHMQEQPPPLRGHPALDPVLRKALAKDREERYASCAELIEAAAAALGLAAPVRLAAAVAGVRSCVAARAILAAGLLMLAAAIAAAIVALTGGEEARVEPLGNGVAAIDPANGEVASFTESDGAAGQRRRRRGRRLGPERRRGPVSRIDPETKEVTGAFKTPGTPTQLAAGAGALWVGNGGGRFVNHHGQHLPGRPRVRTRSREPSSCPTRRAAASRPTLNTGFPQIAVGAGAVWARNPDGTHLAHRSRDRRARRDDRRRRRHRRGRQGGRLVRPWDRPAVKRIDPRTNRVAQTIPIGANSLPAIAVGAGSVWATAENEGLVWRIEPGPRPITRTIDVGVGVGYIAFGDGAVWAANYIDGTVSRIDPRTNAVTARMPVGAPQALAAGEGSAWVSVAGAPEEGTLPAFACGEVASGGGEPDVLIASDLPLQGPDERRTARDGRRDPLRARAARLQGRASTPSATRSCDDSTAQSGELRDPQVRRERERLRARGASSWR